MDNINYYRMKLTRWLSVCGGDNVVHALIASQISVISGFS